MHRRSLAVVSFVILTLSPFIVVKAASAQASSVKTDRCYDPNDPRDIRIWSGNAPGAVGTNPCTDIPFLRIYAPESSAVMSNLGIVVMPGGGYNELIDTEEQAPVAEYFANRLGITSFVLYYRLVQANGTYRYPVPMWDAQRAIRYVRANAAQYGIAPDRVGVFGFSAGGHLASTVAIHFANSFGLPDPDSLDETDARPDFVGLGYPVISMDANQYASPNSLQHLLFGYSGAELSQLEQYLSGQDQVNQTTPPTFLFESQDDKQISSQNSTLFSEALNSAGVPSEVHIFEMGLHGDGLAKGQIAEHVWPRLFRTWLAERGLLAVDTGD
jgi:acetyl esterase/lipase